MKKIISLFLCLALAAGMTACGEAAESSSTADMTPAVSTTEAASAAAESAPESSTSGKMTADGRFLSEEEELAVPPVIKVGGVKAAVGWTTVDGINRIQAVTEEIDGHTYSICESGTDPASNIKAQLDHPNAYLFAVGDRAATGELLENGNGFYHVKISNESCIRLTITPNDLDEAAIKDIFENKHEETLDLYDAIITDFINASEIIVSE